MRRFLTILTLSTIAALPLATPAHAGADPAAAETEFAQILNSQRASAGLAPLSIDPALSTLARGWSGTMAATGSLQHNPNLGGAISSIVPTWSRYGENIAYGQTPQQMSDMLWNSAPHKANIMGAYNRVGVGVAVSGSTVWVTFDFVQGPPLATGPAVPTCSTPGYLLDGFGAVHSLGGAPAVAVSGYWPGWDIARDVSLTADRKGYVLDGFGGLHPAGGAPAIPASAYWSGWDIARSVAVTPDGSGAYVLDGWGGVHRAGSAPAAPASVTWPGWDIARDIQVDPTNGHRGYVLDGFGGLQPFGGMPKATVSAYYPFAVAKSLSMLSDGSGGYMTDLFGGLHPFAVAGHPMPPSLPTTANLPGPIAMGSVLSGSTGAVVTAVGGEVGVSSPCATGAMFSWGIARAVATPAAQSATLMSASPTSIGSSISTTGTGGRAFSSTSAWNTVIPPSPVIDPSSNAIRSLLTTTGKAYADYDEYGVPVFDADASTPKYNVTCLAPWGTCGLSAQPVPIPDNASPNPGSDGAMVVIDWSTRTSYEFWQASKVGGAWVTSWGGTTSVDGDGVGGSAVGSGVSRLAGVVRANELASGVIDHALVFSSSYTCGGTFRAPAIKTDGTSTAAGCIPEGTRIQLDPSINVDAIPGITAGERAVGHALQKYGAYCIDSGGSGMGFSFERVPGSTVYASAGFGWDYFNMGHIPWSNLRVLRQWNGA